MAADPEDLNEPDSTVSLALRARLGERIRGLRLERGLRLADIAALSGLSEPHLSRLERGLRWPSVQVLLTLADIYGVDASILLLGPAAPAFTARHEAHAIWEGREASGEGAMFGRYGRISFDRESRLAMDGLESGDRMKVVDPPDKGSPEELLAMAFAGSFSMALARQLEAVGFGARAIETQAEVKLLASALGHAISGIRLRCDVESADVDQPTLQELAQLTKHTCVVGRALLGVTVSVEARLVSAAKPSRWVDEEVRNSQHDPKQSEPSRRTASNKARKAST